MRLGDPWPCGPCLVVREPRSRIAGLLLKGAEELPAARISGQNMVDEGVLEDPFLSGFGTIASTYGQTCDVATSFWSSFERAQGASLAG